MAEAWRFVKRLWRLNYLNWIRLRNTPAEAIPRLDKLEVLHRCEKYVIVNKQAGVLINNDVRQRSDSSRWRLEDDRLSVQQQIKHNLPEVYDSSLVHGIRFCHRLDYATSGALCLATSKAAAAKITNRFSSRVVRKQYLALVWGTVKYRDGALITVRTLIGRLPLEPDRYLMCVPRYPHDPRCEDPQQAETRILVLETGTYQGKPASKLLLMPWTGRTHQLRVHCHHIGHVIVGDYAYSGRRDVTPYRMMLDAHRLTLPLHDVTIDVRTRDPFVTSFDKQWIPEKKYVDLDKISEHYAKRKNIKRKRRKRKEPFVVNS